MQMVDLPSNGDGLAWILSQGPARLRLLPGLHPAFIEAAAAGDQQVQAHLCFRAQQFATLPIRPNWARIDDPALGAFCHAACQAALQSEGGGLQRHIADCELLKRELMARQDATSQIFQNACKTGQLAAAKWLRALCGMKFTSLLAGDCGQLIENAAKRGDLDMLIFLRSGPHPAPWRDLATHYAVSHPTCLQWLVAQGCPLDRDIATSVAAAGDLDLLKWLRSLNKQITWDESVTYEAASRADLPILRWLRSLTPPIPLDSTCMTAAAAAGDMPMMEWLHGEGCPMTASATMKACCKGHLRSLQWLRGLQPPCPWDESCTTAAMQHDGLSIITWLRTQHPPCPWKPNCIAAAARRGSLSKVQFLRGQQPPCPWNVECSAAAAGLAQKPALLLLEWMLNQEPACPVDYRSINAAARQGSLEVLELLYSKGCPVDGDLYYEVADDIDVLKWLYQHSVPASDPQFLHFWVPRASLMLLGDMGIPLHEMQQEELVFARKKFATFHGLLRWCRKGVSNPSRGCNIAYDLQSTSASSQHLLMRLSLLPPELIDRICFMAELQHDLIFDGRVDLSRIHTTTASFTDCST